MVGQDIAGLLKVSLLKGPRILSKTLADELFLSTADISKSLNRCRDLEDFVAVIDGRHTIMQEIGDSASDLREYLANAAGSLVAEPRFLDALPGFVLDEGRVPLMLQRLTQLARLHP